MPPPPTPIANHHCEPQRSAIASGKIDFHALTKGHYPGTPVAKNILPGLNHIGFWNAAGKPDWGLNAHRNEGVEIMFLETGTMDFMVDHKNFQLRAGNFTITRPWQLHKLGAPHIGPGRLHWLILDVGVRRPHQKWNWPDWVILAPDDLDELTSKLRLCENPVWQATPTMINAFKNLAREICAWKTTHAVSRMAAHLNLTLVGMLDAFAEQPHNEDALLTSHERSVELFLRDLETGRLNPGEPWSLEKMASQCGMGITAFSKYCRQIVNAGPVEFLNDCRLDKAMKMLKENPAKPVTEVALACGFNSSQYFATKFLKRFRRQPSKCR